jgi:hypothetical protein
LSIESWLERFWQKGWNVLVSLTNKECLFIAGLLEQGSDPVSDSCYSDMDDEMLGIFSKEQKDVLSEQYHDWNGDPESFEQGCFNAQAWPWMDFFADKLRKMANEIESEED